MCLAVPEQLEWGFAHMLLAEALGLMEPPGLERSQPEHLSSCGFESSSATRSLYHLGQVLRLSLPLFPHLKKRDNDNTAT